MSLSASKSPLPSTSKSSHRPCVPPLSAVCATTAMEYLSVTVLSPTSLKPGYPVVSVRSDSKRPLPFPIKASRLAALRSALARSTASLAILVMGLAPLPSVIQSSHSAAVSLIAPLRAFKSPRDKSILSPVLASPGVNPVMVSTPLRLSVPLPLTLARDSDASSMIKMSSPVPAVSSSPPSPP